MFDRTSEKYYSAYSLEFAIRAQFSTLAKISMSLSNKGDNTALTHFVKVLID